MHSYNKLACKQVIFEIKLGLLTNGTVMEAFKNVCLSNHITMPKNPIPMTHGDEHI